MTIKKLKSIDIINVLSDLVSDKLKSTVKLPEINLICCYRRKTRADTVAAMTAALPYMETEIQELAERTAGKLKQLTEGEFVGLVFLPAEDME